METYQEFLSRINSFEKAEVSFGAEDFVPSASVVQKVNEENQFSNFYGDTVVFELDSHTKHQLSEYVKTLYEAVPQCFCEKLRTDTFHMTLHDLSNAPVKEAVAADMQENESAILLQGKAIVSQTIDMRTKYVFNMVNTSLVLGLYPVNESEYVKLMNLYTMMDSVKSLPYPFTPHITLAYYNRHGFKTEDARKLEQIVKELNRTSFEIQLRTEDLYYQHFTSMNAYQNIKALL